MREKHLYSLFAKTLTSTCAWELKICKTNALPFSSVAPHQLRSLKIAKHGVFRWKLGDYGYLNPFDGFVLAKVPAYIVIVFYKPRKPISFLMIDIDVFLEEMKNSTRKSLTEERAISLSVVSR